MTSSTVHHSAIVAATAGAMARMVDVDAFVTAIPPDPFRVDWRPRDVSWWIVAANLAGSIAFLISAFAAYIDPETGTVWRLPLANLGTFVGAVGFFVGALLLIPEMRSASAEA